MIQNGTDIPRLEIKKVNGTTVTINLPMPSKNTEDPNPQQTRHNDIDKSDLVDYEGFKPRFILDYSAFIDGSNYLDLRHLLESEVEEVTLVPHVDFANRKFKVRLVNFGEIARLGVDGGHRGIRLQFESTEILDAMPFPAAAYSGKTWGDLTSTTWADLSGVPWHFFR